jgi:chromosome segregation ATPase
MAGTQIRFQRSTVVVSGTNTYEIIATCIIAGTLPDTNIFLLDIITVDDPKDDTLVRVVQVADTVEFVTDRDDAITAGDTMWRSPAVTLRFDDIETANAAAKELSSRVNTLVETVDTYNEEFETIGTGEVTTYPIVDPSLLTALTEDYTNSLQPVTDAETARDEQQETCTQLNADLLVIEDRLEEAQGDLALYQSIQAKLTGSASIISSVDSALGPLVTATRNKVTLSAATPTEKTEIEVELQNMDAQLVTNGLEITNLENLNTNEVATTVATLQTRASTLSGDRNAKILEISQCSAAVASLQGELDAARATRDAALAAVVEVCPEFVPTT